MAKTILHVDMNSYFATVEQQANPHLRGKPVGIIKAAGRACLRRQGCVIAASVEAKKYGVKTGVTVWEAKRLCPQIVLVPSDMDRYFSLTERLMRIVAGYSPIMEIFSIDECFADVSETQKLFSGGALEIALEIKRRVGEELGEWMRCSVGISFTKLLAKLASEMNKPDGLTWLTAGDYLERTRDVPVEEVCGIGWARTRWLQARGAYTLGRARELELPRELEELVWLRVDEPLTTVAEVEPAKSVSRTYTTFRVLRTKCEVLRLVRNLIEEACAKLREMGMAGRTYVLSLSGNSCQFSVRKTVRTATDDPLIIYDLLVKEYEKDLVVGVRRAGVWVTNLIFNFQFSLRLRSGQAILRREELLRAVDRVNGRWGWFTLYPASLLGGELVRPEVTGYLGDKWYRFGGSVHSA